MASVASIGRVWGQPTPSQESENRFLKIKFTSFHAGGANGAVALTYLESEL